MHFQSVAFLVSTTALLGCPLATSPTEYVTESTSAAGGAGVGGEGGAPASGGGGAGGDSPSGGGGAGATSSAEIIVIGGYQDRPPELVDANYFEDEVYDTWRADVDAESGLITGWRHEAPTPLSGVFPVFQISPTGLVALGLSDDADSSERYVWLNTSFEDGAVTGWSGGVGWDYANDRDYVRTAVSGPYAYHLVGIEDDKLAMDTYSGRVEYTTFDAATGAIGASVSPGEFVPLARARRSFTVVSAQGVLYVVGGYNAGNRAFVDSSVIDEGTGENGPWVAQTDLTRAAMPHAVYNATACVTDTHLYVIGGQGNNGPSEIVLYTAIDASGAITEWSEAPPMTTGGLRNAGCFVHDSRLYVLGGEGPTNRSSVVLSSDIAADGSLSPWVIDHEPLPYARSSMSIAVQTVAGGR